MRSILNILWEKSYVLLMLTLVANTGTAVLQPACHFPLQMGFALLEVLKAVLAETLTPPRGTRSALQPSALLAADRCCRETSLGQTGKREGVFYNPS